VRADPEQEARRVAHPWPTKLSVDLPASVTEFEIPAAITATRGQFKFEIIARTSTGNNTAVESCFITP
jgi:hypothetical protein